jgi:hypothetical protein
MKPIVRDEPLLLASKTPASVFNFSARPVRVPLDLDIEEDLARLESDGHPVATIGSVVAQDGKNESGSLIRCFLNVFECYRLELK